MSRCFLINKETIHFRNMSGNDYFFNLVINDVYNDIDYLQLGLQLAKEEFKNSSQRYNTIRFLLHLSNHYNLFNSCIDNNLLNEIFSLNKFINKIRTEYDFNDFIQQTKNNYRKLLLKINNSLINTWPEKVPIIGTYKEDNSLDKTTTIDFFMFVYKNIIKKFKSLKAYFPFLNDYLLKYLYPIPTDFDITLPLSAYVYMIENNFTDYPRTLITGKYAKFDIGNNKFYIIDNITQIHNPIFIQHRSSTAKNTCLERYGVENPLQNKKIKEKQKNTCLERYGVENPMQNEEIKEKLKNTCLEKYGVEYSSQNEEIKEKRKNTCLERYGVECSLWDDKIHQKTINTCLEKYGVEHPLQNENIKQKVKDTCLERYGVENPLKNEEIKEKQKNTCLERYGVESPLLNEDIKQKSLNTRLERSEYYVRYG